MSSRFETLPCDILQIIAFLSVSASVLDPPIEILHLLLTHRFIYRSLRVSSAPNLYAGVFFTKFDTRAPLRRFCNQLPDSAFAAELLARCQLLRRVHRADFSPAGLNQDLWTALWMFLESEGLNESQLSHVRFSDFILSLARSELVYKPKSHVRSDDSSLKPIIVWLLCLALRRGVIRDMSTHDREALYSVIFPFIFASKKLPTSNLKPTVWTNSPSRVASHVTVTAGEPADAWTYLELPDPSTAAINLAFAIFELDRPKLPYHVPKTRAIAIASQRFGPTQEDYEALASYRTPLFADLNPIATENVHSSSPPSIDIGINASRSFIHDFQFGETSKNLDDRTSPEVSAPSYIPGSLTGMWEGVYRTVDCPVTNPVNPIATVVMIKPMHFSLAEYISYDLPGLEKGLSYPSDLLNIKRGSHEIHVDGITYRKYQPLTHSQTKGTNNLDAARLDVILFGETTEVHDHAWGPHKFTGRVHKDGLIVLERERKHEDGDDQGLWLFEGHLHLGTAFLGRWRITGVPDNIDHGIFSLGKSHEISKE